MLTLCTVTDEDGHPLENEEESGRKLCHFWRTIFQARAERPRYHQYEDILRFVQKALDDIRWVIDNNAFAELMTTKKESVPGPDGNPYSLYSKMCERVGSSVLRIQTCAGGWYYSCSVSLSPSPPVSMTMKGLFDQLKPYTR